MTSIRYRDRTFDATEYMSEPVFGCGNDLSRGGAPVRFPVLEHRNNTTWALAKAFGGDESYGILLRDTYGRGQLLTLAVPDAISDIRKLPQTVLTRISAELCCGPVYLDAPAQISLFPYDNDAFCIYPDACDGCAAQRIRVRVRGVAEALCPLELSLIHILRRLPPRKGRPLLGGVPPGPDEGGLGKPRHRPGARHQPGDPDHRQGPELDGDCLLYTSRCV